MRNKDINKIYGKFIDACFDGKINKANSYLEKNPEFVNGLEGFDNPISSALITKHISTADYLLEKGANINQLYSYNGIKNTSILIEVVQEDAVLYYDFHQEEDPLKIPITSIEYCIAKGININHYNEKGRTALDYCVEYDNLSGANYLYSKGGRHSKVWFKNTFPAITLGKENIYKKFLPYLKDMKEEDCIETVVVPDPPKPKTTGYHYELDRIYRNYKKYNEDLNLGFLEKCFSDKIFSINERDYLERTPVDYAIELGHHLAVDYLRSVGGKTSKELEE